MSQSVKAQSFPPPAHPVLALQQRSTRGPRTEPWGLPGAPQHRGGRSRGQLCVTINLFLVLLNFFLNFFSGSFFVSIFLYNYPFLKSFFIHSFTLLFSLFRFPSAILNFIQSHWGKRVTVMVMMCIESFKGITLEVLYILILLVLFRLSMGLWNGVIGVWH